MPYTILPDGTIKADTLDETLAYLAERNRRARASASEKTSDEPSTPGSAAAAEANRDPWTAFVALASVATMKERRRFLSLLKVSLP